MKSLSISAFVVMLAAVGDVALILGLLQMLSWVQCAIVVFTGAAISGGVLFTVLTMQNLSKQN